MHRLVTYCNVSACLSVWPSSHCRVLRTAFSTVPRYPVIPVTALLNSTGLFPKASFTFLAPVAFQDGLQVEFICCRTTRYHSLLHAATPTPEHRSAAKRMRSSHAAPTRRAFFRAGLHNEDTPRHSLPTPLSPGSRSYFSTKYSDQSAYYIYSRPREHQSHSDSR